MKRLWYHFLKKQILCNYLSFSFFFIRSKSRARKSRFLLHYYLSQLSSIFYQSNCFHLYPLISIDWLDGYCFVHSLFLSLIVCDMIVMFLINFHIVMEIELDRVKWIPDDDDVLSTVSPKLNDGHSYQYYHWFFICLKCTFFVVVVVKKCHSMNFFFFDWY